METKEKALEISRILEQRSALDISVIYIGELSSVADYIVLASGASERQVSATGSNLVDEMKLLGVRPLGIEGKDLGHWLLVDYGDVVLHLFHQDLRQYYDMDGLWADAERIETKQSKDKTTLPEESVNME